MNTMLEKILNRPFFIRLLHWEYWPFNVVYGPIYCYWLFLCLKARSFFFFNTSNPTIENGGLLLESKKKIYDIIPPAYYPPTLFFKAGVENHALLDDLHKSNFKFPLIAKPDIGGKGRGVKKLDNIHGVLDYARTSKVDFLLQEFVDYENEAGIFYFRYPDKTSGFISGIVEKEFLSVTGDGISTIEQLLQKEQRFILQLSSLKNSCEHNLGQVLRKDEQYLVPYGNHARGAKFIDASNLIDEQLTTVIDNICKSIPDFYFGRLDVRFGSWEELRQGKNFSIIELNGAGSEPTHMYDPNHSIFFAWKEIIRHWNILYKISKLNHRALKIPYLSFYEGIRMLRENSRHIQLISKEDKSPHEKTYQNILVGVYN